MKNRSVSVWYDGKSDMLEVLWAFHEGSFTPTDDDRVLKRIDDGGEVIGFLVHEVSTLRRTAPVVFELAPDTPADDVLNLTVRHAATELGISERRVRQLARESRIRGAVKHGNEWLIPSPVEVTGARHDQADNPRYLTAEQAAQEVGITATRLRQLARAGRVRDAFQEGRQWRIPSPVEFTPGTRGPVGVAGRGNLPDVPDDGTRTLDDLLGPDLDLVFVGLNPAEGSARCGHYYANDGNGFWRWLSASPLVDRELHPQDDRDLPERYGIGLTDVVKRVETDSAMVSRDERQGARPQLERRIAEAAPRAVCFNSADAFEAVFPGRWRPRAWGQQDIQLAGAEVWVMPSSSSSARGSHKYASGVLDDLAAALGRR